MKPIKIKNVFALKIQSTFEWGCWQINTPFVGMYGSKQCTCFILNLMFFEIQFWFGDVENLI